MVSFHSVSFTVRPRVFSNVCVSLYIPLEKEQRVEAFLYCGFGPGWVWLFPAAEVLAHSEVPVLCGREPITLYSLEFVITGGAHTGAQRPGLVPDFR